MRNGASPGDREGSWFWVQRMLTLQVSLSRLSVLIFQQ